MYIYKEYDKESLDRQYNNRLNAPDHEIHIERWENLSKEVEKKYSVIKDITYGEDSHEKLTIFPSPEPNAKTLVFIHGGYWYKHIASDFYLIAEAFRAYGFTTVLIDYPLMPEYTMNQLVLSCRKAILWLCQYLPKYNSNPDQMYVSGHSAGAHLAVMMMTTKWSQFNSVLKDDAIKGVCAISGLYNLIPIQLCYINEILKMDKETALLNSPVQLLPETHCPLVLAVGASETAEYLSQSRELSELWTKQNLRIELIEIAGLNHFSILETMLIPSSALHQAMCHLMQINA